MNLVKKIVVTTCLTLFVATTLWAKPSGVKACTADGKNVGLVVTIDDDAPVSVLKNVSQAFTNAAASLPAARLITVEGFKLFAAGLSDESKEVTEVPGPPRILDGSCKVSKS